MSKSVLALLCALACLATRGECAPRTPIHLGARDVAPAEVSRLAFTPSEAETVRPVESATLAPSEAEPVQPVESAAPASPPHDPVASLAAVAMETEASEPTPTVNLALLYAELSDPVLALPPLSLRAAAFPPAVLAGGVPIGISDLGLWRARLIEQGEARSWGGADELRLYGQELDKQERRRTMLMKTQPPLRTFK